MITEPNLDWDLISTKLLREYLELQGWTSGLAPMPSGNRAVGVPVPIFISARRPARKPEIYHLGLQSGSFIEIAVPDRPDLPSFWKDLEDVVATLSEVEGKPASQVITDIHSVGFDVIRNRIPTSRQDRGTIPLELAKQYIQKTKDLLSAAATTEMEPNAYFKRTLKEAIAYSDQCRFGHTFKGSFGFTIESAVPANHMPTLFPVENAVPFERRVIRRLVKGLELARTAVEHDDLSQLVDSSDFALGANGYELIADLVAQTPQKHLAFDFTLSPVWKESSPSELSLRFELSELDIDVLRSAAKQMREPTVDIPAEITGLITDLSLENPSNLDDRRNKRRIVIVWSSQQFGDIRVAINVSAETYLRALNLHRESRPISIAGNLRKVGRNWNLIVPTENASAAEEDSP